MHRTHGRVAGAAVCIGDVEVASLLATGPDQLRRCLDVNVAAAFNALKASVKARRACCWRAAA